MRSVVCSTLLAVCAASFLGVCSHAANAAEIGLPYAQVSARAQVAGIAGNTADSGYSNYTAAGIHVVHDLRQFGTVDSYGNARARSATFDSIGVFASLDARRETLVPPGSAPVVDVASDAARTTFFRVESDSLPLGSPVETSVRIHFVGATLQFFIAMSTNTAPNHRMTWA